MEDYTKIHYLSELGCHVRDLRVTEIPKTERKRRYKATQRVSRSRKSNYGRNNGTFLTTYLALWNSIF